MKQYLQKSFQRKILLIIVIFFWFAQYVFMPFQTTYLYSSGITAAAVGIIVGIYGFAQLIFRMPIGLIADKIDIHKFFIIIGILSAGIASLFRIFFPPDLGFLIGNIFSGFASAMWISFMVLYFSYFEKEEHQKASSFIVGANNFGILLGFIACTLLYERFGMKLMCYLSIAAALIAFLLSLFIRGEKRNTAALPVKELVKVYADRRLIVFSILALIQQGIQISTSMTFTTQIAKLRGANNIQIGLCSIVYILTAVLSSYFAAGKTAKRIGSRFWIPAILICLALYCVLIPNLPSAEWICIAQILSGISTGILFSYCTSEAMQDIPEQKSSTAMGFYQAIYAIGMTTFPILTGKIANTFTIGVAFYILSGISIVGVVISLLFYSFIKNNEPLSKNRTKKGL